MIATSDRIVLFWMSGALAGLAGAAAVSGLVVPSLYRPMTADALMPGVAGQDLLTVLAATGVSLCLLGVRRGAERLWLVWVGLVGYLLYAYALYAFERIYNPLFLVYVAILGLSVYSLIVFFRAADLKTVRATPDPAPPRTATGAFLLGLVALFVVMWLSMLVPALAARTPPDGSAIFVLDLAFFLPLLVIEGALLLRGSALGDALAIPVLVKLTTLGASVLLGTLLQPMYGVAIRVADVLVYGAMAFAPVVALIPFLRRIEVDAARAAG